MPNLQGDVKVPLLGNVPKKGVVIGVLGGGVVVAYVLYRRHQANLAATKGAATGYGYGATAYGYGESTPGYYGYGSAFQGYPSGEAYGYGAYGYGMYNPVTGQYYGPGPGPITSQGPPSWWNTPPSWWPKPPKKKPPHHKPHQHRPGTSVITSQGNMDLWRIARMEGITEEKLLDLNPHLKRYQGTGKHVPRGIKVRV